MKDLASMYEMACPKEKKKFCASLLMQTAKSLTESGSEPTACELARIALAEAIITEALACGPGE